MLETWKIVVISVGVLLILIINAGVFYKVNRSRKSKTQQEDTKSYDIEAVEERKIETHIEDQMEKYGQQFVIVTPAQTALSPPRHPSATEIVPITVHEQRSLRVFSLSPLNERQTPASNNTDNNSLRTATPLQNYTPPPGQDVWRGPTPVFTQYPGHH